MTHSLPLKVTMSEFRDNLSAYLDAVQEGKTVTITRRGRPSAVLTGATEVPEAIDLDDLKAFRASLNVDADSSVVVRSRQVERY